MKKAQKPFRIWRSKARFIEDAIPWIGASAALAAAIILDSPSHPHRWHPAIMWTVCTFTCAFLFGRDRWTSIGFWLLSAAALGVHLFAMWALFGRIIPATFVLGAMSVAPIGFIEGILILGLIGTLMGWSSGSRKQRDRRVTSKGPIQS
jgi:uncharacterized membrane protein